MLLDGEAGAIGSTQELAQLANLGVTISFQASAEVAEQLARELPGLKVTDEFVDGQIDDVRSGDEIGDRTDTNAIDLVVPGVVAFAVMVSAYANLASRLAVLRADGVLKRIRTTPLDPRAYLTAQLLSTLVTTLLASAATILLGFGAFDVSPRAEGVLALALGLVLGIICFAALGLALSSAISHADAAGPITHATYLPLALVSGVFDPSINIPGWLETLVSLFPVQALVELLVAAYDPTADGVPLGASLVLAIWGMGAIAIAMRTFSWVPSRN